MNIQNEKKSEQLQIVSIEICKEDYAENVETALKKQRRTAQVPGFRPGNAPMGMIKRMYEKSFIADTVNNMMFEQLNKYIQDNKIDILGEPLPVDDKTVVDFEHPEKFVFAFEIASQKPFEIDYAKFPEVTLYQICADKEEMDNMLMEMRRRFGQYTAPETISDSDFVTVEYGENNNSNFYANDLNEKGKELFIGKHLKDVVTADVKTIFDDENKLAAFLKTAPEMIEKDEPQNLEMTVKYIGHLEPAEVNDDFFKKAYPDGSVKNEKELMKEIALKIEAQYKEHSQRKFMNDAIGILIENTTIELPEEFLKRYILYAQKDLTEEKLNEEFDKYLNSFRWQLLENKLTKDNDIHITENDVKDHVRNFFLTNYFAQFNPEDVAERVDTLVADTLKNKDSVKNIYDQLFDNAIGEVLMKNMKSKVKKVTFKEFADELYGIKEEEKAASKTKKATTKKAPTKKSAESEEPKAAKTEEKKAAPKAKKATTTKTKKTAPKGE